MRNLLYIGASVLGLAITAQGAPLPAAEGGRVADYERAVRLKNSVRDLVLRDRIKHAWSADGTRLLFETRTAPDRHECFAVGGAEGVISPAFDGRRVAVALAAVATNAAGWTGPGFDQMRIANDGSVQFEWNGRRWAFAPASATVSEVPAGVESPAAAPSAPRTDAPRRRRRSAEYNGPRGDRSPNGQYQVFFRDHNLWIRTGGNDEAALTTDGREGDAYEGPVHWAPDSSRVVVYRTLRPPERQIHIVEPAPSDQLQPRLHTLAYAKPGDPIANPQPRLFDPAARREVPIAPHLSPTPWFLGDVRWMPDSRTFTFFYNERGHQRLRIVSVEGATGAARALVDEQSETFIDYSSKLDLYWLDDTRELIWMSERSGWNHLYLYDTVTGAVKNPITSGEWLVKRVLHVDREKRRIWFVCLGAIPGQDPYQEHIARANLDGTGFVLLTDGNGTHGFDFDPARPYFLCWWSRPDHPRTYELRETETGRKVCELSRSDWTRLQAAGWRAPEPFVAKGRDGATDIYGLIHRPTNFDPGRRYPVIENIYAGPQDISVPKPAVYWSLAMDLAELGFIVVEIDGMGTNWRSKKFHDVCWKNLGDAGFPDRIAWIRAAAAKYPQMDLARVGIFGGSAGGQNAMRALIAHNDFYHAAAADCGCHDNRMDKIWWNEQWMGWPVGPHYEEQSNVTQAHRMKGRLLLSYGGMDRNVDPASTPQVVQALIQADKDFELVYLPQADHGAGAEGYGWRRTRDFFVRSLLGVEPRAR